MEYWGCEFLEEREVAPPPQPVYKYLPLDFILKCVDSKVRLKIEQTEQPKLNSLRKYMEDNGIPGYGELTVGANGLVLSDGNHRLIVAEELKYKNFPVKLVFSEESIRSGGVKYQNIIKDLLWK